MIAILGAMQEEITPMLELVGEYEKIEYASNTFYKAKFHSKDIIIAYSKIGKVNAAITATIMIEKFKADKLLFSGVAGSLNSDLHICDIIYATKVAQHDLDITAFGHPHGYVPGIDVFCNTDGNLNQIAMDVAKEQSINLIGGVVASGDQFICAQDKKDWIKATFGADAVEMEGASVGQVCAQLNVPFFMLRAISDEASGGADMDFDEFLDKSAKISAKFVLEMVKKI